MAAENNKNALKWTQHPLISTVLWWSLGTDATRKENVEPPSSSTLKWRDQGSGENNSLNEYINHVQPIMDSVGGSNKMEEEPVTICPGASRSNASERHQQYEQQQHQEEMEAGAGGPADYTPSPQWGFWVPITPPQPEMYAQGHRNSH